MENNYIKLLTDDLKKIWAGLSMPQKFGLMSMIIVIVALSTFFLVKSLEPDWAVLYTDLNETDAANIIESLKKNGHAYKLADDKKTIMVHSKEKDDLRVFVAENDLIQIQTQGFELLDDMQLGSTDFKNKLTKQRIFQGELTRSIEKMSGIQSVRVQLAEPERSIFQDKDEVPTASVMLILKPGYRLKSSQVKAIKNLVAYSVPRMTPDRVFITDQAGNSLSDENGKNSNDMESFKSNLEKQTSEKAVEVLEKIVGKDNVNVQVSADIDFNSAKATIESYIPVGTDNAQGVVTSSQSEIETYENPNQTPSGANVDRKNLNYSKEKNAVNYSVSKEVKQIIYAPGTVKRMTIAVAVNKILTQKEKDELKGLVLSAAGADYERGDVITITSLQFEGLAEEKAAQAEVMKEFKKNSTVDYMTTKLGPLLVILILGLAALFIIKSLMSKAGKIYGKEDTYNQKVIEPTLPEIKDDIPDIILSESLPTIEAHLDPELEKTRIELNETIMADPAEAARILTSFIRN